MSATRQFLWTQFWCPKKLQQSKVVSQPTPGTNIDQYCGAAENGAA